MIDTDKVILKSDIAAIAGVGAPAVSNWIARYPDFPKPIAVIPTPNGSARPGIELYDFDELIQWLQWRSKVPV